MKIITRYFFMTLIIIQGFFILLYYTNFNLLGILSWIGRGEEFDELKFFSPLILYGAIKICYWIAEPLAELFNIILRWVVLIGTFYLVYWLFFI